MPAKNEKDRKNSPTYLVFTPVDELIDDGLQFEGETEKDRTVNSIDFIRIRELMQNLAARQMITKDLEDTLIRTLKACVKEIA